SHSWFQLLVQKNPSNYKNYQRINKSWFVANFSSKFEVLSLHNTCRMKKISKNRQSFLVRKAMHIYKSTILFLPILGYFCLFLPICKSLSNLHEFTLLFALNIHAYFCLFFII